jgi:colanic acid biosynthesis glycosyl transferase WcaI
VAGRLSQDRAEPGAEARERLKILIFSQYFWPETFRVNDFASELIARGHQITIFTGKPNYPDGRIFPEFRADPEAYATFEGAPVHRVPIIPRGRRSLQLVANYASFVITGLIGAWWKLRRQRFDAIFVFETSPITSALPAVWLKKRLRAPVLMWVLDLWPETLSAIGVVTKPKLLALVGEIVRHIYRRCDRILVQSRAFTDNVRRYAGDIEKVRYFPGWAETVFTLGTSAEPAPELAPYQDDFKILFAGNIGEAQDFPAIIAAADLLREESELRWLIVGDGRAAEDARAEVNRRKLEDKIVFLGRFPLERMPSFFTAADALLVSLKDQPIWGMTIPAKVQSYLAAGRPLLGMLSGEGARVIGEAQAGLAGPAGDPAALAVNVRSLMRLTAEERALLGRNGQAYCRQEFDRATLVDRFEDWVRELSCEGNGPSVISPRSR